MKHAIVSDVHANPQALERVLADAERYGVEKVVCAGDVVGYGPDPAGAIRILRERGIPTVMGNHDAAVVGWRDTGSMNENAREGTARHRKELGEDDLSWLKSLPYIYEGDGFAVAHANFVDPKGMVYIQEKMGARASLMRRNEQILFVGHTHVPAVFTFGIASDPHFPDCTQEQNIRDFRMVEGWQYLVNVGSMGYPRVKPYSSYVIFDSATGEVQFRKVEFDFADYKAALRAKSIPVPPWMDEMGKEPRV